MVYTIYKAVCLKNNKSYIGFDSNWPHRKWDHKACADRGVDFLLYRAIRKYGWKMFVWEILYQSHDYEHTLKIIEPLLIQEHKTMRPNGYNMTLGGEGTKGRVTSKKRRKEISNFMKKRPQSEETRQKRSQTMLGIKKKPFSKEHKAKLILAHIKTYKVTFPNGNIQIITNMRQFCRDNSQFKLDPGSMVGVAKLYRGCTQHKGFKVQFA